MSETVVRLSDRELASVLAGLRIAQKNYMQFELMEHFRLEVISPLTVEEIDALCERINGGER